MMVLNPRQGQPVQVWYRGGLRDAMPLHGQVGEVVIISHGKPRNHGVRIDGVLYAIPCGHLRKAEDAWKRANHVDAEET